MIMWVCVEGGLPRTVTLTLDVNPEKEESSSLESLPHSLGLVCELLVRPCLDSLCSVLLLGKPGKIPEEVHTAWRGNFSFQAEIA